MKNYEKYAEEIKNFDPDKCFCKEFVEPHILKSNCCDGRGCDVCRMLQMLWLLEECEESEEPKTDWSKVKVDAPIRVRDTEDGYWHKVHFAKYKDGEVYAWLGSGTSWTSNDTYAWKYAKLAQSEEGGVK